MKALLLVTLFVLFGCGRDDGGEAAETKSDSQKSSNGEDKITSIALESKEDLPACNEETKHMLAYIIDSEIFMTCQGTSWVEIEIKGKDGENGVDGKDGSNAQAEPDLPLNSWIDPFTSREWVLVGSGQCPTTKEYAPGCFIPDYVAALEAASHGLLGKVNELSLPTNFWANDGVCSGLNAYFVNLNSTTKAMQPHATLSGIYCYKQ